MMNKGWDRQIVILLLSTLLAIFFYGYIDHPDPQFKDWDSRYYLKMAESFPSIDDSVARPFSFRLAGPFIAGAMHNGVLNTDLTTGDINGIITTIYKPAIDQLTFGKIAIKRIGIGILKQNILKLKLTAHQIQAVFTLIVGKDTMCNPDVRIIKCEQRC